MQFALVHVDSASCLIVMDWAMKYLPQRHREQMSDFFGKRGRSLHVSAVITNRTEKFQVEFFVHLFDNCTQNSFAVAPVIEYLLKTIKKESQEMKMFSWDPITSVATTADLFCSVFRSLVNEPAWQFCVTTFQSHSPEKTSMTERPLLWRRWVNEKHNVITAEDMQTAL